MPFVSGFVFKMRSNVKSSHFLYIFLAFNLLVFNWPLFNYLNENINLNTLHGIKVLLVLGVIVHTITFIGLAMISLLSINLLKVSVFIICIGNSLAMYFMLNYQVILDKTMMGNIFNTRFSESGEFLTVRLMLFLLILALGSVYLIFKVRIIKSTKLIIARHMGLHILVTVLTSYVFSNTWLWIDKNAKYLGGQILPWSYIANSYRYYQKVKAENLPQTLLPKLKFVDESKQVVVLVVGETARSKNFSLYGYHKNTNPTLSKENIKVLPNTKSCSTYTTASIACMLSHKQTIGMFDERYEPLPSYLARHGVKVVWRTNNWGEPKINVTEYNKMDDLKPNCSAFDCDYDGILLHDLDKLINNTQENKLFIVLHQKGSHGPLYFKRYPEQFNQFKPTCKTVEIQKCLGNELMNAYDNTILYTDFFLASVIKHLKQQSNFESTLIYISDHGESLGENGLYLHGTPMAIAPEVQYEIPFIIWNSANEYSVIDQSAEYSHQSVFHSVMGSLGVTSEIYDASLDVFN